MLLLLEVSLLLYHLLPRMTVVGWHSKDTASCFNLTCWLLPVRPARYSGPTGAQFMTQLSWRVSGVYLHRKIAGRPCAWLCLWNDRLDVQRVKFGKGKSWKGPRSRTKLECSIPAPSRMLSVMGIHRLKKVVNSLWWWGTRLAGWTNGLFLKPSDNLLSAV